MRFLKLVVSGVTWLENLMVIVLGAVISTSVFLGVFYRYVLRDPLIWSGELALICFAWLVFWGASLATRQKAHMSIDALTRYFPPKILKILQPATLGLMILLLGVLIFYGLKHAFSTHTIRTTALQLPWTYVFLSVPTGSAAMLVHVVDDLAGLLFGRKEE